MQRTLRAGVAAVALTLIPVSGAIAAPYASRTLKQGASGSDVEQLQGYLDDAGYATKADGEFGPNTARSVRRFEKAEARTVDGKATRSDQRLVESRADEEVASEPASEPTEDAYVDEEGLAHAPASAPSEVQEIIAAGNKIASKPYKYGGGHGRWRDSGYDCSGSVSYALHGAGLLDSPLDSTGLAELGRERQGRLGDRLRQRGPRVHGRGRTALRHKLQQALRHALDRNDAVLTGVPRPSPGGTLMALVALLALMLGSFAGLLIGRWAAALPLAAAIPAAALLAGPELGAVGLLGAAGVLAGVQLHHAVAEQYSPR